MATYFTMTIKSGDDGVTYSINSEKPVLTRDLVGVLEMCKLMAFEKKIPSESVDSETECGDFPSTPQQDKRKMIEAVRKIRLADEKLPIRAIHYLQGEGIVTLEDLLRYTREPLLRIRNLGRKTVNKIEEYVQKEYKYELGTLAPIWIKWWGCEARLSDMTTIRRFSNEEEMEKWIRRENCFIIQGEEGLL